MHGFRDLIVYQKAYLLSMEINELTRIFPKEEKYALTDQIRRSSRSIPANIAESWAKRLYLKAFVNKIIFSPFFKSISSIWHKLERVIKITQRTNFNPFTFKVFYCIFK